MTRVSDEEAGLLLAGDRPDGDLEELAALVRSARALYLEPAADPVRERHEAMILAASRDLAPAEPVEAPRRRFGLVPRIAGAVAAVALALGVALAFVAGGPDAPRVSSDRPVAAPLPERAAPGPPRPPAPPPEPETRSAPAPPPPQEADPPVPAGPEPGLLAERPPPPPVPPADPEPAPPQRGFGGPEAGSAPLKGPLDTEPPISGTPP